MTDKFRKEVIDYERAYQAFYREVVNILYDLADNKIESAEVMWKRWDTMRKDYPQ